MKPKARFCPVILAGGQGERMSGLDKGLIPFQGKPMIEWVLALLKPQFENIVISCNRNHLRYMEYGFQLASDEITGFEGPLAGIHSAMHKADDSCTHLLVLPCDTPLFDSALVRKLITSAEENTDAICFYRSADRLQFLHAVIPLKYCSNLDDWLEQGERAVYKWYRQFPIVELDATGYENSFLNVNRKQDIPELL
ncbi:MAG: molybdenum cofactor guanylyltransferase [Planctomycetes bacterium]|nr:molybdenum cofactor guanylyltransferase [Planctomycetota bacterium]